MGIVEMLCLAAVGCTGDADLGAERVRSDSAPALSDAGNAIAVGSSSADAAAPPQHADAGVDAGAAPLVLEFRVAGASVTQLHVACPDTCVEVGLAAVGGTPPYLFSWDDASAETPRRFCPASDASLGAVVHDARGRSHAGVLDVHVSACGQLCGRNLSFEGVPTLGAAWLSDEPLSAAPWDDCRAENPAARTLPRIVATDSGDEFPAPSDGASYLYLEPEPGSHQMVAQDVCAPLEAGSVYSFKVDLARAAENNLGARLGSVQVEVYGATTPCRRDELLWTSPRLGTGWRTFCLTLRPTQSASALTLNALGPGPEASGVFVDHIVPVASCP